MSSGAMKRCDGCGGEFGEDALVQLSGKQLCGACKAERVKDLQSGVAGGMGIGAAEADAIKAKIKKLNLLSFAFALPGLGLQFGGAALMEKPANREEALAMLSTLLLLRGLGILLLIVGLSFYARMRGRSWVYGLLGLLSCLGLLILYFLPKSCHHCAASVSYRAPTCRSCGAPA